MTGPRPAARRGVVETTQPEANLRLVVIVLAFACGAPVAHRAWAPVPWQSLGRVMSGLPSGPLVRRSVARFVAGGSGRRTLYFVSAALRAAVAVAVRPSLPRREQGGGGFYPRLLRSIVT